MVEAAADDPSHRLSLAADFYRDRPGRARIHRYQRAELAFMHWQIQRGVMAPLSSPKPGSAWWRGVNASLLCDAWEADLIQEHGGGTPSRPAVERWLRFLADPSPRSWYRAHNASIVTGYAEHRHLIGNELPAERFFMDVTLGRVLLVHGLLTAPRLTLGRWLWPIGHLGDPRWSGVNAYLSLRNVLPREYPLSELSMDTILDAENIAGRLIDYGVLLPRAQALYELAAADLHEPQLLTYVRDGSLTYAWPFEDRDVWQVRRSRRLVALVARLTPVDRP